MLHLWSTWLRGGDLPPNRRLWRSLPQELGEQAPEAIRRTGLDAWRSLAKSPVAALQIAGECSLGPVLLQPQLEHIKDLRSAML